MIRDFSRDELEPVSSNDTELTLGLGAVLGLGGGLILLCVICFVLGYFVGHRSVANQGAAVVFTDSRSAISAPGNTSKPGAGAQAALPAASDTAETGSDNGATSVKQSTDAAVVPAETWSSDRQVRPALQNPAAGQAAAPVHVQPATSEVQGWMVQIAAVSRSEDADVLVSALRKRGYTVSARRELGDNMIHVQTGPFTNRNDANSMRQKLLSDGYNAIVQ